MFSFLNAFVALPFRLLQSSSQSEARHQSQWIKCILRKTGALGELVRQMRGENTKADYEYIIVRTDHVKPKLYGKQDPIIAMLQHHPDPACSNHAPCRLDVNIFRRQPEQ
jgi:hypothetical protein